MKKLMLLGLLALLSCGLYSQNRVTAVHRVGNTAYLGRFQPVNDPTSIADLREFVKDSQAVVLDGMMGFFKASDALRLPDSIDLSDSQILSLLHGKQVAIKEKADKKFTRFFPPKGIKGKDVKVYKNFNGEVRLAAHPKEPRTGTYWFYPLFFPIMLIYAFVAKKIPDEKKGNQRPMKLYNALFSFVAVPLLAFWLMMITDAGLTFVAILILFLAMLLGNISMTVQKDDAMIIPAIIVFFVACNLAGLDASILGTHIFFGLVGLAIVAGYIFQLLTEKREKEKEEIRQAMIENDMPDL